MAQLSPEEFHAKWKPLLADNEFQNINGQRFDDFLVDLRDSFASVAAVNGQPVPPAVNFDPQTRQLTAIHPLGAGELEYAHQNGGFSAYAPVQVDDQQHPANEWQFRVKAAQGRNPSQLAPSPPIAAKTAATPGGPGTIKSTDISDSTAAGRALLTATDAAAQRLLLDQLNLPAGAYGVNQPAFPTFYKDALPYILQQLAGSAQPLAPAVTGFLPAKGAESTSVTITGRRFTDVTTVLFNGTPASFQVINAATIQAVVPAGATTGPVSVATATDTGTSTASFEVGASTTAPPATTPDAPFPSYDPVTRILTYSHALGTSELEYNRFGGAFTPYTPIQVDDAAHSPGEWKARVRAYVAGNRAASGTADSPAIGIKMLSQPVAPSFSGFDDVANTVAISHPTLPYSELAYDFGGQTGLAVPSSSVISVGNAAGQVTGYARATASRPEGLRANSPVFTVTAANTAPTITMSSPQAGQSVAAGSMAVLNAYPQDAENNLAKVEFLNNGVKFAETTVAPHTIQVSVTAGTNNYTSRAIDTGGLSNLSNVVTVSGTAASTASRKLLLGVGDSTMRDTNTPGATTGYTGNTGPGWWDDMTARLPLDSTWDTVNLGYAGKSPGWALTNVLDEIKSYLDFTKYTQVVVVLGYPGGNGITSQFNRTAAQEVADLKALAQAVKSVNAAKTRTVVLPYINRSDSYAIPNQDSVRQNVNSLIQSDNSSDFDIKPLASSQLRVYQTSYPTDTVVSFDKVHFTGSGAGNGRGGAGIVAEMAAQGVALAAGLTLVNPAYQQNLDYTAPTTNYPTTAGTVSFSLTQAGKKYMQQQGERNIFTDTLFFSIGANVPSQDCADYPVIMGKSLTGTGLDSTCKIVLGPNMTLRFEWHTEYGDGTANQGVGWDICPMPVNTDVFIMVRLGGGQTTACWVNGTFYDSGVAAVGQLSKSSQPINIGTASRGSAAGAPASFISGTFRDALIAAFIPSADQLAYLSGTNGGQKRVGQIGTAGLLNLSTPDLRGYCPLLGFTSADQYYTNLVDNSKPFALITAP